MRSESRTTSWRRLLRFCVLSPAVGLTVATSGAGAHPGHRGSERLLKLDLSGEQPRFSYALVLAPEQASVLRKQADTNDDGQVNDAEQEAAMGRMTAALLGALGSFYNWVDANNGIGQFNHPGDNGTFSNYQFVSNVSDNFKLMETANGGDKNKSGKFIGHYNSALAKGWKLAPTANLDNHSLSDSGIRTGILANSLTRAGVYEAMQARRVFSSDDLYIEVRFSLGDHWMGEEVRSAPGAHTFTLSVSSDEVISKLELIVKGVSVASSQPGTDTATWSPTVQVTSDTYAYTKVTEADGDVSLSAPIWIDVP